MKQWWSSDRQDSQSDTALDQRNLQQQPQSQDWKDLEGTPANNQNSQQQQPGPPSTSFRNQRQARQEQRDPFDSNDCSDWPVSDGLQPALNQTDRGTSSKASIARESDASKSDSFEDSTSPMSEDDYWNQFLPPEGQPKSIGSANRTRTSNRQQDTSRLDPAWSTGSAGMSNSSFGTAPPQQQQQRRDNMRSGSAWSGQPSTSASSFGSPWQQQQQGRQQRQQQEPALSKPARKGPPQSKVNSERMQDRKQKYRAAKISDAKTADSRWTSQPGPSIGGAADADDNWSAWDRSLGQQEEKREAPQAAGASGLNSAIADSSGFYSPSTDNSPSVGTSGSYSPSADNTGFYSPSANTSGFYTPSTDDSGFYPPSTDDSGFYTPSTDDSGFYRPSTDPSGRGSDQLRTSSPTSNSYAKGGEEDEWGRLPSGAFQQVIWVESALSVFA